MFDDTRIPDHLMLELTELPRLPVDHNLGNWMDWQLLMSGHPAVREIVRIAGISLFGLWHNQDHGKTCLERAVQICADLNRRRPCNARIGDKWVPGVVGPMPETEHHLSLVFQPFRGTWKQWPDGTPPMHTGDYLAAELDLHRTAMERWRSWLAEMNAALGSNVQIKYTVADIEPEGWFFKENNPERNNAIVARYNDFHRLAKEVFPGSQYVMYGNLFKDAQDRYDGRERYDVGCTSLYAPLEPEYHVEMVDFAKDLAFERRLEGFAPWLALAAGCIDGKPFDHDVTYPTSASWDLGKYIAEQVKAGKVIGAGFYPGPLDKRTPGWLEQFIAYVLGVHGIRQ